MQKVLNITTPQLAELMSEEKLRFYIESGRRYRFAYYDPENPYRKNGLFDALEDSLNSIGEKFKREYGEKFISINLRGSWLRGIPFKGDDIDVLFIINDLNQEEQRRIIDRTRQTLTKKNNLFQACEGKVEFGLQVEPINFLDFSAIPNIFNSFMFGCQTILGSRNQRERDAGQDALFGSKAKEKLVRFLKSGILIPYVGWVFGQDRKTTVFAEIAKYLPIPSKKTGIYSKEEVDITKEIIRTTFIARNLIYPALNIKRFTCLAGNKVSRLKEEALSLYAPLSPLENIHARAVINYMYISKIEIDIFGQNFTKERIKKFAPDYDRLVSYIHQEKYELS